MSCATVLHVTSLHGGGVDRHIRDILRAGRRRHLVWYVGERTEVIETPGPRRFFALHRRPEGEALADWLRRQGVGIVHAHSVAQGPRERAGWAAGALAVALVTTLHDVLFLRADALDPSAERVPDALWLSQVRPFLARAAARIAPSEYIAALARKHLPGQSVTVIENGSPPSAAEPLVRVARPAFLDRRPQRVAVVLGAIGPHKGSRVLEAAGEALAASGIALVVIGYLDAQATPGWRNAGLFIHGAYDDAEVAPLVRAYGADIALFANTVPESFSYALSDLWRAGLPALVPDEGALGERVRRHGGGWLLPRGFGAEDVVARVRQLLGPGGERDVALAKSRLAGNDAGRVPDVHAMTAALDALYERFGLSRDLPVDPASAPAQALLATHLDGSLFRPELARLAEEAVQLRAEIVAQREAARRFEDEARGWIAKLERDVGDLQRDLAAEVAERRRLGEENARLAVHEAALAQLPRPLRQLLLKRVLRARG